MNAVSFFDEVKSFARGNPKLCTFTLGLAIVGFALNKLAGRAVVWIRKSLGTTAKTDQTGRAHLQKNTKSSTVKEQPEEKSKKIEHIKVGASTKEPSPEDQFNCLVKAYTQHINFYGVGCKLRPDFIAAGQNFIDKAWSNLEKFLENHPEFKDKMPYTEKVILRKDEAQASQTNLQNPTVKTNSSEEKPEKETDKIQHIRVGASTKELSAETRFNELLRMYEQYVATYGENLNPNREIGQHYINIAWSNLQEFLKRHPEFKDKMPYTEKLVLEIKETKMSEVKETKMSEEEEELRENLIKLLQSYEKVVYEGQENVALVPTQAQSRQTYINHAWNKLQEFIKANSELINKYDLKKQLVIPEKKFILGSQNMV